MNLELDILLTNDCPCRCTHCFVSSGERLIGEPTFDQLHTLFVQAKELGVREIHFTGGEPFLRQDLEEIVEDAINLGIMAKINTSGVGVTKERLKVLSDIGVKWMGLPLEGCNPETHDKGKKYKGAYEAALKTMREALALGFHIEVTVLITNDNYKEIPEAVLLLADMKVDKATIFYYSPVNRGRENQHLQPSIKRYKETIEKIRNRMEEANKELNIVYEWPVISKNNKELYPCRIPLKGYCIVLPDGQAYPCPLFTFSDLSIGNVYEESIIEIMRRDWLPYNDIMNIHKDGCESTLCTGGCPAYIWLENGNFSDCDPRCTYNDNEEYPCCMVHVEHLVE